MATNSKTRMDSSTEKPSRSGVHLMFDRISHRYDFLNHFLSGGMDIRWRRRAVAKLQNKNNLSVLDLACGTGDLALTAVRECEQVELVLGVDMAQAMLALARDKIARLGLTGKVGLACGDGMSLPVRDSSFDATMIAFGIRNMPDTAGCLRELLRTLKPGGRLIVLEFSLPQNRLIRALYLLYFRHILPRLGSLISGDACAYRYLDRTVETYEYGDSFKRLLTEAGFLNSSCSPLTFGIATIYVGDKSDL